MKSMVQMQNEMLARAKFNGEWPRAVIIGLGCIALANDQDEYDRLQMENFLAWKIAAGVGLAVLSLIVIYCVIFL